MNYIGKDLMVYSEKTYQEITPVPNSRFAKAGVWCFYGSEVLNSSFVHLIKFNTKNPRLRKAPKR
jgi:hypothetical protein